jgi:maltokinase
MHLAREDKPGDLVAHLAASWPPAEPATASDYVHAPLAGSALLDAVELGPAPGSGHACAVAVARSGAGDELIGVPLVHRDGGWRRATAGDGVAAALLRQLTNPRTAVHGFEFRALGPAESPPPRLGGEAAITADQTNESVVVAGAVIVKWVRQPRLADHPAPRLLGHLAEAGFTGIPEPGGFLLWHPPGGQQVVLASVDAFLPGAVDGWTWCVDDLLEHIGHRSASRSAAPCPDSCPAGFAAPLGRLTADLHAALATPSSIIPDPVRALETADIARYRAAATDVLDRALDLTGGAAGEYLRRVEPRLRASLRTPLQCMPVGSGLTGPGGAVAQPIHGDLHVGQVLRWRGGLAVIDFDGNPALPATDQGRPEPAVRDAAQMLRSLDHVGRVADRRTAGAHRAEIEQWISDSRRSFLAAYTDQLKVADREYLFEPKLLEPFEVEQECRELVYAATYLPRWTYAPMAALCAMFPLPDQGAAPS